MQNIDELLIKQRDLIIQMDKHHQRQINSLHERISRVESQIQMINNSNTENNEHVQLSKDDHAQRSNIEMSKGLLSPSQSYAAPSASQDKLPKLNPNFPR